MALYVVDLLLAEQPLSSLFFLHHHTFLQALIQ